LAQTTPAPPAKPSATKPSATKPSAARPTPAKPSAQKRPEPAKPDAAQSGPCGIGVIPHIGEHFALQSIGLTAFGNDFKEVPIEPWGLDDLVVARVRAAAGPGLAVRRITYPASAFESYDHPALFHIAELKPVVQSIAGASGCERYVVVVKGRDAFTGTNQVVDGIGIVNRFSLLDRNGITYLFAMTSLEIFDGHTFEDLKHGAGLLRDETLGERMLNDLVRSSPLHGPSRELKDFAWPPAPDAIAGLRDPTRALLAESLDKALPKLLAPPAPSSDPPSRSETPH
jgi:hypothetical protein